MKIYTKTGDRGETGLFGGPRVPKDDPRIEAYGTVDELNSFLGLVRCEQLPRDLDDLLAQVQNDLFSIGAELATPDPSAHGTALVDEQQISTLEKAIDHYDGQLPALREFILPAGTRAAALLHVARTVCRRAERRVITMLRLRMTTEVVRPEGGIYLNRLSDLLFVLARAVNASSGQGDVPWRKPEKT